MKGNCFKPLANNTFGGCLIVPKLGWILFKYISIVIIRRIGVDGWINELMDHSKDLDADPVIYKHLIEIEGLLCDPIPKGLGLSKRCVLKLSTILTIKF